MKKATLIDDAVHTYQKMLQQQRKETERETRLLFERCFPDYEIPKLEGDVIRFDDFVLQQFDDGFYLLDEPLSHRNAQFITASKKITNLESLGREIDRWRQEKIAREQQEAAARAPKELEALEQKLLARCQGDPETAQKWIQYEREKMPGADKKVWLQEAIKELEAQG